MIQDRDRITLKEAMKIAETGVIFDVAFFSADAKRKKAGEYLQLKGVCLQPIDGVPNGSNNSTPKKSPAKPIPIEVIKTKRPSHRTNGTRNLIVESRNGFFKIHPRLMEEFNGKEVVY
jgi:hypothetical protein